MGLAVMTGATAAIVSGFPASAADPKVVATIKPIHSIANAIMQGGAL